MEGEGRKGREGMEGGRGGGVEARGGVGGEREEGLEEG